MRRALRFLRHAWHRDLIWRLEVLEAQSHVTLGALAKARVEMVEVRRELFRLNGSLAEIRALVNVVRLDIAGREQPMSPVGHHANR